MIHKKLYDSCMKKETKHSFSASDVALVVTSPFSLWCKYNADHTMKDKPDPFLQHLASVGIKHEEDILKADYPDMTKLSFDTPEDGFKLALESMYEGISSLANPPLFYLPNGMFGFADILEKVLGDSVFGGYHYAVREIKSAININESHLIQTAFYTKLIGLIQQRMPEYFSITNGEGNTTEYSYIMYEERLSDLMRVAKNIRDGTKPSAIYGGGKAPWITYTNDVAISNNDVSLISGIGPKVRDKMADAGFVTFHDVANSTNPKLQKIPGIGKKKSESFLNSARALRDNKCIQWGKFTQLPHSTTEIFLDLEGVGMFDDSIEDYLIGALVRKDDILKYHPFVAEGKREDVMLESFVKFMDSQTDYTIYHWHHYERTHLHSMMEKYDIPAFHLLEPSTMIDLYKVVTNTFAFPTYSNSIKDVAKWLGFKWRHENVGATSAIQVYLNYIDDNDSHKDSMGMVIDYNEDDCIATQIIKDWYSSQDCD